MPTSACEPLALQRAPGRIAPGANRSAAARAAIAGTAAAIFAITVAAFSTTACEGRADPEAERADPTVERVDPTPDIVAERAALKEADVAFWKAADERGVEGFVSFLADDVVGYSATGKVHGKREFGERWRPLLESTTESIRWTPDTSDVAASGDLGYTRGRYEITAQRDGDTKEATGDYVTIWRKQPDGTWKVVLDIGNPDGPPPQAGDSPAGGARGRRGLRRGRGGRFNVIVDQALRLCRTPTHSS